MSAKAWQRALDLNALLAPELEKLEKKRRGHLLFLTIGLPLSAIVGVITFPFTAFPLPYRGGYSGGWGPTGIDLPPWAALTILLLFFCLMGASAVIACYKAFDYDYRRKAKRVLVYKIAAAMRMRYQPTGLFRVGRVYDHYIFPAYNIDKIEDGFIVKLGRRMVELQEIRLHRTYSEGIGCPPQLLPASERGIVLRIEARKTQPFHTVVVPRKFLRGAHHQSYFRGMHHYERTPFGNPAFGRRYEVLSEDHSDAHDILNPDFIEKFLAFEKSSGAKSLSASFKKREIVIYARNARDLFEPGHLLSPVNVRSIRKVYEELEALDELVQTLDLNPYVGL